MKGFLQGTALILSSTVDQEIGVLVKKEFNKSFQTDFKARPDDWQLGKVSARERRLLFAKWTCDAVEVLMGRRDIIRRAFRGTGVGIDAEGKMKDHIRFPGFSYVPPEKDEDHEVADLIEEEIKALEKKEEKLQKQIKKRKLQAKDKAIRERAKKRARNLLKKPTI